MISRSREVSFLLGLPFNVVTMKETIEDAVSIIESRNPSYFITANVDFVAQARTDEALREILFHADLAVCDGMPLVWLSRVFKPRLPERVAGSDMVFKLFEEAHARKWKVYFLGSDSDTLKDATQVLNDRYPDMKIVGSFSPPFGPVETWPNEDIIQSIREAQPDLLLVAVGCPKQEYWISKYYESLSVPLSIGIGASLDFVSGTQVRAPLWLQKIGMEWSWRLLTNPKRLLKRYAKDFFYLIQLSFLQWKLTREENTMSATNRRTHAVGKRSKTPALFRTTVTELKWSGNVELQTLSELEMPANFEQSVLIDMSEVDFMDSSGIGYLAKVARNARQAEVQFGILNAPEKIRHMIRSMRLEAQFPVYDSRMAAQDAFDKSKQPNNSKVVTSNDA